MYNWLFKRRALNFETVFEKDRPDIGFEILVNYAQLCSGIHFLPGMVKLFVCFCSKLNFVIDVNGFYRCAIMLVNLIYESGCSAIMLVRTSVHH